MIWSWMSFLQTGHTSLFSHRTANVKRAIVQMCNNQHIALKCHRHQKLSLDTHRHHRSVNIIIYHCIRFFSVFFSSTAVFNYMPIPLFMLHTKLLRLPLQKWTGFVLWRISSMLLLSKWAVNALDILQLTSTLSTLPWNFCHLFTRAASSQWLRLWFR